MSSATETFRAARDLLLQHRADYGGASREFRWPDLTHFNLGLDWFDVARRRAAGPHRAAGSSRPTAREDRLTYAELAERSPSWRPGCSARGVDRGDRLLLMLGNVVPLWEVDARLHQARRRRSSRPRRCSARADLADRVERGHVEHVVTAPSRHRRSSTTCHGDWTRIAVGDDRSRAGCATTTRYERLDDVHARGRHPRRRDAAALLHVGHDGAAQARRAHARVLPGRAPVDDVLDRSATRRRAPQHLLARLGQARLEQRLRAVERRGDGAHRQPARGSTRRRCSTAMARCGVTTFCAPPTVWRMLVQADLAAHRVPSLREVVGAGEPLNPEVIEQVQRGVGPHGPRRLRPDRDHGAGRQPARRSSSSWARWGARCPATPSRCVDPVTCEVGDEGEICLDLSARPLGADGRATATTRR